MGDLWPVDLFAARFRGTGALEQFWDCDDGSEESELAIMWSSVLDIGPLRASCGSEDGMREIVELEIKDDSPGSGPAKMLSFIMDKGLLKVL